ncbi:60S ribosomal protein L6-like isoform X1 [Argiope bruennichi]|uniref:60S ribosomal protein L6-like isoform X1 n=2 Tax=Argiope bruennichi TaxID=94029 RepID=UPI002493F9AC|nr:60S ribosomal protein L6-like isoform X1 [Argiope bruennichi]
MTKFHRMAETGKKEVAAVAKKKAHAPRNFKLPGGVWRYSRSTMYSKRRLMKVKKTATPKPKPKKKPKTTIKPIGGEKNGGFRVVKLKKERKFYPTEDRPKLKRTRKMVAFKNHKRYLRESITPGTVLIMLAGRHRGKRVVFLKQLATGLLLVTGPYQVNGCPLRRVNQIYTIATSTKLDISKVKIPEHLDDKYFRRKKPQKKSKKDEEEIFETKKEEYVVTEQRKKDQVEVDKQILDVIKAHPEKNTMLHYLKALFYLQNKMYPHNMKF